jgi:hypothetical protein
LAFEGVDAYLEELVGGSGRNLWGTKAHLDGDKGVLESSRLLKCINYVFLIVLWFGLFDLQQVWTAL